MYGLIGRILAVPDKRDELSAILVPGEGGMPGCLSYVVAEDPGNPDALWVTEVWTDEAAHRASLTLPAVQAANREGPAADRRLRQPGRDEGAGRHWARKHSLSLDRGLELFSRP